MISMSSSLKILLVASLAASPTMTTAQACQGTGCVLPLPVPAPPPAVYTPPPAPPVDVPVEVIPEEVASKGLGILPFVIGAALIAAILYFVLDKGNDGDEVEAPTSP